jgi:Spy/CpxP family protein refolding chaperone
MKAQIALAALAASMFSLSTAMAQDAPQAPAGGTTEAAPTGAPEEKGFGKRGFGGKHHGKRGKRGFGSGAAFGGLRDSLTADQQKSFDKIIADSKAKNQPLFEKMKSLRGAGAPDDKTKAEFQALREQMKAERKATHEKIMALLTPEQKAKFEAAREARRGGRGGEGAGSPWGKFKRDGAAAPQSAPAAEPSAK